ncbi:MAG: hypothetical protein KatS3mg119_2221 [Rhodothalassiaceae bacterium]|nr:MAG: hypothetical protein KatS3mg119_2221 [Rhodothalassiaceae bacterium]
MKPAQFLPIDLSGVTYGPSLLGLNGTTLDDSPELEAFRAGLSRPALRDFFDLYLDRVAALGRLPCKNEFGPQVMRAHLGYVGLAETVENGDDGALDVVIRLAGTRLVDFIGAEIRGMSVARLFRRPPGFVAQLWTPLFREGRPRLDAGNLGPLARPHVDYIAVHVPLTDAEGRVRFAAFRSIFSLDGGRTWC